MADGRRLDFQSYLFPKTSAPGLDTEHSLTQPIYFQFLPKFDTESVQANYEAAGQTLGRAEQMHIYKSSSNKSINIATSYVADGYSSRGVTSLIKRDEAWVQLQVSRLMALTKPIYERSNSGINNGKYYAPPLVLFTHGLKYINVPVIVEDISVTDHDGTSLQGSTALPQIVNVSIRMKTNYPYGFVPGYLDVSKAWESAASTQVRQSAFKASAQEVASRMSYNGTRVLSVLTDDQ